METVYADCNGTTPLRKAVRDAVSKCLEETWANPSSTYDAAVKAKDTVEQARERVAKLINSSPETIIFTSGGTESNNMVLYSVAAATTTSSFIPHVVISAVEHDSVVLCARHLHQQGKITLTEVELEHDGSLSPSKVLAACTPQTTLVTVMLANNETGVIFPVSHIVKHVRDVYPAVLFHTDAAQAIGKIEVDVVELGVDYLTLVGHKFYGPRVGALYRRPGAPLTPLFYGGGQERGQRPGTENTAMISGLGVAAKLCRANLPVESKEMRRLRNYLEVRMKECFCGHVTVNCEGAPRLPNTCNVAITTPGLSNKIILENVKFIASKGAACHASNNNLPSAILLKSGVPYHLAQNSIRISIGIYTTRDDIEFILGELQRISNVYHLNHSISNGASKHGNGH